MIKFIERMFCKHHWELNRWHRCHGPSGMELPMIESEYICTKCGKIRYRDDSIKLTGAYNAICKEYERRIKQ